MGRRQSERVDSMVIGDLVIWIMLLVHLLVYAEVMVNAANAARFAQMLLPKWVGCKSTDRGCRNDVKGFLL